jgi:hypothetical protein
MYRQPWFDKRDLPSYLRAAIFLFWALFLTGAVPAFIDGARNWSRETRSRDYEQEARDSKQTHLWTESKIAEVREIKRGFSPKMYFEVLAELDKPVHRINGFSRMQFINVALEQAQDNIRHGLFTQEEFRRQAELYETKRSSLYPARRLVTPDQMRKFSRGLIPFYLESILVALLIYVLRMKEEGGGVLRAILADKRRFALALVLWPRDIWMYPFGHIINYLRAEAELRRISGLFRRLSEAERSLVRQVAKLPKVEFRTWLLGHRACFGPLYVRGLALGILGAVVCLFFTPVFTRKAEAVERTPQAQVLVRDGPQLQRTATDDGNPSNSGTAAVLPDATDIPTLRVSGTVAIPKPKVPPREGERQEHIPLSIRLAAVHVVRTPQTERNVWDEEARSSRLPRAA